MECGKVMRMDGVDVKIGRESGKTRQEIYEQTRRLAPTYIFLTWPGPVKSESSLCQGASLSGRCWFLDDIVRKSGLHRRRGDAGS